MKATKLKMKNGNQSPDSLLEIDSVYITECDEEGFYKKSVLYDHLKKHPGDIQVNIYPYPDVVPALSANEEKYVKSTANSSRKDNLLSLPRE